MATTIWTADKGWIENPVENEMAVSTKTTWTPELGWHETDANGPEGAHVCKSCAAIGRFQWTPNAAPTCRHGHAQG